VKRILSLGFTQAGIVFYKPHLFAPGVVRTGQKVFSGMGAFSGGAIDKRNTADGTETERAIFTHTNFVDRFRELGCMLSLPFSGKSCETSRS
jgi:hypothetical protein